MRHHEDRLNAQAGKGMIGMKRICTSCGNKTLAHRKGTFHFEVNDRKTNRDAREFHIDIRNAEWDECESCGEKILSERIEKAIEKNAY